MSFFARQGLSINDLGVFQAQCAKHGVEYIPNEDPNFKRDGNRVVATLRDTQGRFSGSRGEAFLIAADGTHKLVWDNDRNYNSLSGRLGRNGGELTRDYTTEVIKGAAVANGGFIMGEETTPDGSILVRVGVV